MHVIHGRDPERVVPIRAEADGGETQRPKGSLDIFDHPEAPVAGITMGAMAASMALSVTMTIITLRTTVNHSGLVVMSFLFVGVASLVLLFQDGLSWSTRFSAVASASTALVGGLATVAYGIVSVEPTWYRGGIIALGLGQFVSAKAMAIGLRRPLALGTAPDLTNGIVKSWKWILRHAI